MRKLILRTVAALAIAAAPAFAVAQQADSDDRQMARAADSDDRSDWGWMGLLGLVGLLGLKRRERDAVASRDPATAR